MLYIFIVVIICCISYTIQSYTGKLKFGSNNKFKIVQLTDLHYGPNNDYNDGTTKIANTILTSESPDFIAYTGDLVSSGDSGDQGYVEKMYAQCWDVPNKLKMPYGITLGNHDTEGYLKGEEIIQMDLKNEYSMTQKSATSSGASNYFVPIYDQSGNEIKYILWFLYSGNYTCMKINSRWGCVEPEAVDWFYTTSKLYPNVPGIMFAHIPMQEFMTGFFDYESYGIRREGVCCPKFNTGLTSMAMTVNITGIFVGHDHDSDYYVKYPYLELHYGRKTGIYYYGPEGMKHGAKVIELDMNGPFKTWIRNEDGEVETQEEVKSKPERQSVCS